MPSDETENEHRVRLDKWLWAARFFKTRALAAEAIDGGKVDVNGARAKRAKMVQDGDEVRVRQSPFEHIVHVRGVSERRGPATVAAWTSASDTPSNPSSAGAPTPAPCRYSAVEGVSPMALAWPA